MSTRAVSHGIPSPAAAGTAARPRLPFRTLPLWVVMPWLIGTYALFLLWPINWQIYHFEEWMWLSAYVALCFTALFAGYLRGTRKLSSVVVPYTHYRFWIFVGAALAIGLLFPTSYLYTGKWPWQVIGALEDQGDAYRMMQDQLVATTGQRGPIAIARALVAPFTFTVIPLGILRWNQINWTLRILVILTALSAVVFSTLRGTDKQMADLLITGGTAVMILIARGGATGRGLDLIKRYWKAALIVLAFAYVAAVAFTDRKSDRLGGADTLPSICANDSPICVDIDYPLISWMPLEQRFGLSMFIISTAQGYYGLHLALGKDFQSSYGLGHSPATLSIYEAVTGDLDLGARTYTYRNSYEGWPPEAYWSSLITWIANDVGFTGAVLVLLAMGFLWGRTWRDATYGHSDAAAVLFCLLMIMLAYLPANNQVFSQYDGYPVFFLWLVLWRRQMRAAKKRLLRAQ